MDASELLHPDTYLHESEGRLAVDVAEIGDALVITSTIAGAKPEDIAVFIDNDVLTIRGKREKEISVAQDDYYFQECYWGAFSRSIILPIDVRTGEAEATFKNGVLTVLIPKETSSKRVPIVVVDE